MPKKATYAELGHIATVQADILGKVRNGVRPFADTYEQLAAIAEGRVDQYRPHVLRSILGRNFLGIESTMSQLGWVPTDEEWKTLQKVSFPEKVMQSYDVNHILMCCAPFSILDLWGMYRQRGEDMFPEAGVTEEFLYSRAWAYVRPTARWHFINCFPLRGSGGKTWAEQLDLMAAMTDHHRPVETSVLVQAMIIYFGETGIRMLKDMYVRTGYADEPESQATIGAFSETGIGVMPSHPEAPSHMVGILGEFVRSHGGGTAS